LRLETPDGNPVDQALDIRSLPRGEWLDAWTGEMHLGPLVVNRRAPLEDLPVYVRPRRAAELLPLF
jgi:alpha-glucosidase (family GH31 glycosyl hydrolase)